MATDKATGQMFSIQPMAKASSTSGWSRIGWKAMGHIVAPGDWNGDGIGGDLLAVESKTGKMFFYVPLAEQLPGPS